MQPAPLLSDEEVRAREEAVLALEEAGKDLQEVPLHQTVVTATRSERLSEDAPVPTEVLTRRDIERSGARDLGELLQAHPGVQLDRSYFFRGVGIRLQGQDPKHVALLVDGQRVSGRVGGVVDLTRYTLRNVERVEVVKGPAAALYGSDAMGGVVNIITRKQRRPQEAGLSASYGARNELDLRGDAGLARGPWRLKLGAGRRSANGYDLDPSDVALTGLASSGFDLSGGVGYQPDEGPSLQVETDYLWRDTTGVEARPTGAIFDRRGRTELFNTTLSSQWQPTDTWGLSLSLRHSLFRDQLQLDQRTATDEDDYQGALERLWEATATTDVTLEGHRLMVGVDGASFRMAAGRLKEGRAERLRGGLFLQDEWQVLSSPKLTLLPGARLDVDSQFGLQPSPRLAAQVMPLEDVRVRLSYGWGFRAPYFQELALAFDNLSVGYRVQGNPHLRPERSQGATLAVDWLPHSGLQLGLSLFRTEVRDLISVITLEEATPVSPRVYGYDNVSRARTQGGEVSGRLRLPLGLWMDLGYGLTDARNLTTGRPLEGTAPHRVTAQLSGRVRPLGLDVSLRGAWNSSRPFAQVQDAFGVLDGSGEQTWVAPTTEVHARVGYSLGEHFVLFAGVNNLLNAGDAQFIPMPPRQLYGGVSAEL